MSTPTARTHKVLSSSCLEWMGALGWDSPAAVTLGESLSLSGFFCPKLLVPEVVSNSSSNGRWEVVKGQGAGDKGQDVQDDLLDSRLDCKLLRGKAVTCPHCLAECWHTAGAQQICVDC